MLMFALAVFTVVAMMGLALAIGVFKKSQADRMYAMVHGGLALLGSGLVIWVAVEGDERVYINIGLAVVIIILGVLMSWKRSKGHCVRALAMAHGLLAVICYGILAYFTFVR
jgi:hypothetical protein